MTNKATLAIGLFAVALCASDWSGGAKADDTSGASLSRLQGAAPQLQTRLRLAQAKSRRCGCFFAGYDWGSAKKTCTTGPDEGEKDECDLSGMLKEWAAGCDISTTGGVRNCPYP